MTVNLDVIIKIRRKVKFKKFYNYKCFCESMFSNIERSYENDERFYCSIMSGHSLNFCARYKVLPKWT